MGLGQQIEGVITQSLTSSGIGFGNQQYTLEFKGELIASNSFGVKVNGVALTPVVYATSMANTMRLIAEQLLADFPDFIKSATPRIRGEYGFYNIDIVCQQLGNYRTPITDALVSSGASQIQVEIQDKGGVYEMLLCVGNPLDVLQAVRVDDAGGGVVYTGYAIAGSDPAAPVWAIKKVTTTGSDVVTEWAHGVFSNEFVWDDHTSIIPYV